MACMFLIPFQMPTVGTVSGQTARAASIFVGYKGTGEPNEYMWQLIASTCEPVSQSSVSCKNLSIDTGGRTQCRNDPSWW